MNRIIVVGCGGVGGVMAARLAAGGHDVSAVTANPTISDAIEEHGLVATFDDAIHTFKIPAYTELSVDRRIVPFDVCFLAVPPDAATEATNAILPLLTDDAPIVCLPNGLIEERLARTVDPKRLIGGIVEYGARMLGPGRIVQTGPGGLTLGRLPEGVQGEDHTLAQVIELVSTVMPAHRTLNLRGARWSKLAINCAISALGTVGGDRLGVLMRYRFVRRLALEAMTECVAVAQASGVELEKVAGTLDLDWLALDQDERMRGGSAGLLAKHTVLLAVGTKYRKMRSSMLGAIERGRTPSIDFINGEVSERGEPLSLPTPINDALQAQVHAIARGEAPSSVETLRRLFDDSRITLRELKLVS